MNHFIRKSLQKFDKLPPGTARELIETALLDITLLENVVDSIAYGILVSDSRHHLILCNIYARYLLPIEDDESGKRKIWKAVKDGDVNEFLRKTLEEGVDVEDHEIEITLNSAARLLSFTVHPLVRENRIAGSVILVADITRRRLQEARLKRIESLASLTTLAAGVAHEIKNPLAAISIHVQILKKSADKIRECCEKADKNCAPGLENNLEIVNEEIKRLNKIVVDFLFAVRPMDLNLRKTDINELIREVLRLEQTEAESKGIRCAAALDQSLPPLVIDKQRIREALVNLVKNAIEAVAETPSRPASPAAAFPAADAASPAADAAADAEGTPSPGGGGVIRCTSKMEGERVLITIEDNGPGIAAEDISHVFEPYWTSKSGGSGLGLTLVFKVIQAHNGEITIHSAPGEGACFLISLPAPRGDVKMITGDTMKGPEIVFKRPQ